MIEHACIWIVLTLICVNWTRTENEEKKWEREGVGGALLVCSDQIEQDYTNDNFCITMIIYIMRKVQDSTVLYDNAAHSVIG